MLTADLERFFGVTMATVRRRTARVERALVI
jgi:hypothetical protein